MPHTASVTPHNHHQQQMILQQQPLPPPLPLPAPLQQQQQTGMMMFNNSSNNSIHNAMVPPAVSLRNVHVLFEGPKAHEVPGCTHIHTLTFKFCLLFPNVLFID
jgi:hypothetical protein